MLRFICGIRQNKCSQGESSLENILNISPRRILEKINLDGQKERGAQDREEDRRNLLDAYFNDRFILFFDILRAHQQCHLNNSLENVLNGTNVKQK